MTLDSLRLQVEDTAAGGLLQEHCNPAWSTVTSNVPRPPHTPPNTHPHSHPHSLLSGIWPGLPSSVRGLPGIWPGCDCSTAGLLSSKNLASYLPLTMATTHPPMSQRTPEGTQHHTTHRENGGQRYTMVTSPINASWKSYDTEVVTGAGL